MASACSNFKNIFSRPHFTIIFRPKILPIFHFELVNEGWMIAISVPAFVFSILLSKNLCNSKNILISSLDLFHGSFSDLENRFLLAMMASYSISFIAIDMGKENYSIDSYIIAIRAAPCWALLWVLAHLEFHPASE